MISVTLPFDAFFLFFLGPLGSFDLLLRSLGRSHIVFSEFNEADVGGV